MESWKAEGWKAEAWKARGLEGWRAGRGAGWTRNRWGAEAQASGGQLTGMAAAGQF